MQSESAIENPAQVRGRRRKRGSAAVDGPVFVDSSGRRARLLSRIGMLVGVVCLGYAVVLGMAFMGWGTSLTPSSLLPFDGGRAGSAPAAGYGPTPAAGYGAGYGGPRGGAAAGDGEHTLP
ncbi:MULTISPECIES: hypothetical protein [unclassified Streptomyces]|uniref:hypothetical protein n=1 Tax=unclassified Streptomyces TaxID=2593676 RepID=UPI0030CCAF71